MRKITLVTFLIAFLNIAVFAGDTTRCSYVTPHQADNWIFRLNAGIKFLDNTVISSNLPLTSPNVPYANGTSTLSDTEGNLLLYTDGMRVWNKNHVEIGGPMAGNLGAVQSCLLVPNPYDSKIVYVFTADLVKKITPVTPVVTNGLNYSKVDLTARSGDGQVVSIDNSLLPMGAPLLSGVKHANGTDFWVITHELDNNKFHAFKVDESGVNTNSTESAAGMTIDSDYASHQSVGTLKFSPKGDKLALASYGNKVVELFSFDNNNGSVSYVQTINVSLPSPVYGPYYLEFSPDGTKLYVTVLNTGTDAIFQHYLYQYDLENGAFEAKLNPDPYEDDVFALQLGRDGKIYVTRKNKTVLGVIENPNREGTDCNYKESVIDLGGSTGMQGLPNFITSFLDIPPLDYDTKCLGDITEFKMLNTSNVTAVDWDFGDPGSTGNNLPNDIPNPSHVFSNDSTFTVTYTEHYLGKSWTSTMDVTINPLPVETFKETFPTDTVYIVNGSSIVVYGNENMYSYFWQDGSSNSQYNITQPGAVTVLVEDMNCCQRMDTLNVVELLVNVPTAFSPDGDGLNETFRALGPIDGIVDLSFSLFNKWGQLVWTTNNFDDTWDGKMGSEPAPTGLYNWYMTLNVAGNQMNNGKVKLSGTLMLFR